jgi:glycosyltransferase involved in cell wall biosynthesis
VIIAVPSKGRAGSVKTQAVLPSCRVYVPRLEVAAYRKMGTRNVVAVPDDVRGITRTRNWILRHARDPRVVMIDDDVRTQGYTKLLPRNALDRRLDEPTWLAEFEKLFDLTEQLGLRIWGIRTDGATRSCYPYFPFRFRAYITASCMGILNDGRTYFDESYAVKEDYELCARCIKEDGGVLSAQYLYWVNEHWTTEGGCTDYRTQQLERDTIRRLIRQYPGMIRAVERAGSQFNIQIVA